MARRPRRTDTDPRPGAQHAAGFEWQTLKTLSHYLWPAGQLEMKTRVVIAMVLLALAKIANVYVPVLLKQAVDVLNAVAGAPVALPLGLLVAYGIVRIMSIAFAELRAAVFA